MEEIYYEQILDNSQEAVLILNNEGIVFYANQGFTNIFGIEQEDILGKKTIDFIIPDNMQDEYSLLTKRLIQGEKIRWTTVRKGVRERLHVEIIGSPIIVNDEQKGFFLIYRDITGYKETEIELAETFQELKNTTQQLVHTERMTALGELSAGIAHELNQPLNNIKIISQDILRDINKERLDIQTLPQSIGDIVGQINKMSKIIEHMRIFTRRSDFTNKEKYRVNETISNMFLMIGEQFRVHNIEIIKDLAPNLPNVVGSKIGLEQAFTNLLVNARDAVQEKLKSGRRIEIKSYLNNNQIIISVKNNGGSIPLALRNRVFEPFFTTKEPGKGTGLGLSISRKILEEHGGTIVLEDRDDDWTEFTITIPTMQEKERVEQC